MSASDDPVWDGETQDDFDRRVAQYSQTRSGLIIPAGSGCADTPPWKTPAEIFKDTNYSREIKVVTTGYRSLDQLLSGGFRSGGVTIIGSRTASGKSQLACNLARRSAKQKTSVLLLSLEDGIKVSMWRMSAAESNIPMMEFLNGFDGRVGNALDALRRTYSLFVKLPLRLCDERSVDAIEVVIGQHVRAGGDLVIIDQLSKISTPHMHPTAGTYERINEISERLRLVSTQHETSIVVVCQVNRNASASADPLQIHDLRDSGMLEQDAAAVLLLDKAEDGAIEATQRYGKCKIMPVRLAKQRFGPSQDDPVRLNWYPSINRIDDPATVGAA